MDVKPELTASKARLNVLWLLLFMAAGFVCARIFLDIRQFMGPSHNSQIAPDAEAVRMEPESHEVVDAEPAEESIGIDVEIEEVVKDEAYFQRQIELLQIKAAMEKQNFSYGNAIPLLEKPVKSKASYAELLSSVPSLGSALRKLRPVNKSEIELVRLLSIADSIIAGWSLVSYAGAAESQIIANLLIDYWGRYPDIIAASHCVYCGESFRITSYLASTIGMDEEWGRTAIKAHPRFMQLIDTISPLSEADRVLHARYYALLETAGDSSIAEYIAHILILNGNYNDFAFWAKRGLNGSNSLNSIRDISVLPKKYLIDIWEHGMRGGYVNAGLTCHLLGIGHRPALRYVIWMLDGGTPYLQDSSYKYNKDKYIAAVSQYSEFPVTEGPGLSDFYSKNWKKIKWDDSLKKWGL